MTNSQKAFEEWFTNHSEYLGSVPAQVKAMANVSWQQAWDARGKFDEEVLYNLATERFAQIGAQGMRVLSTGSNEIRKRGGE